MRNHRLNLPPATAPRRPRTMPHTWLRLWNGFADDPKWRRVAGEAGLSVGDVIATAAKLLEVANIGRPRGSVAEFSPVEWASSLRVDPQVVQRIWAVLEQIGWIDREYITKWDRWQPDKEDPTHRERQARYREKKQRERLAPDRASPPAPGDAVTTVTVTEVTPLPKNLLFLQDGGRPGDAVTTVTVTPRAETEKFSSARELPTDAPGLVAWLYGSGRDGGEGLFLVMNGCQRGSELYARNLIGRWLNELGGNLLTLAQIIRAAAGHETGLAYEEAVRRAITQQVAIIRDRTSGQASLKLPISGGIA